MTPQHLEPARPPLPALPPQPLVQPLQQPCSDLRMQLPVQRLGLQLQRPRRRLDPPPPPEGWAAMFIGDIAGPKPELVQGYLDADFPGHRHLQVVRFAAKSGMSFAHVQIPKNRHHGLHGEGEAVGFAAGGRPNPLLQRATVDSGGVQAPLRHAAVLGAVQLSSRLWLQECGSAAFSLDARLPGAS